MRASLESLLSVARIIRLSPLLAALACAPALTAADTGGQTAAGPPDLGTIGNVVIEGTKRVHQDRIRFLLTTRAGRKFDQGTLDDDLKAIARMGPFYDPKVLISRADDGKLVITIRVTEVPYIGNLEWEGLDYFQRSDAEKVLQSKAGGDCNQVLIDSDRRALERHFQDKGYRYVKVQVRQQERDGAVNLTFAVDLGREMQVGRVVYKNLPRQVAPKQLDQALLNGPSQPYHPEMMSLDQQSLIRALHDLGWLDAKLVATHCEQFDYVRPLEARRRHGPALVPDGASNDAVVITYELDPGERYYLGSVNFAGNTVASSAELREAFGLAEGAPFKAVDIDRAVDRSKRVIGNQGYARCYIPPPDRRVDAKTHIVHLTLHIEEGRRYRIGRVDVSGNYGTKDAVVRRAVMIKPGDLWNDDAVDESRRQIRRTDLFRDTPDRPMRINSVVAGERGRAPGDRPDEADLSVNVEEQETGSVQFQLGYSSSVGVFLQGGYTERNFDLLGLLTKGPANWRGAGQSLGVDATWSTERTGVRLSWSNPHLLDGPFFLSTALARSDSTIRDWREVRLSPSVTLGRRFFNNDLLTSGTYRYTDMRIKQVYDNAPNDALDANEKYFSNTVGLTQAYDRLDSPRLPTRGYRLEASELFTGVPASASFKYWEYNLEGHGFAPLFEGEQGGTTFFHLGSTWRQLHNFAGEDYIPFFARYYGGGPAPSHRGFAYSELTPHEFNRNGRYARVGGTSEFMLTGELVIPIQDANDGLRFVTFVDHGNVWGAGEPIAWGSLRTAAGFGIRFPIQIPVALDFAWLLDAKDGESQTQIQFTLGMYNF